MKILIFLFLICFQASLSSNEKKIKTLYHSLSQNSASQHLSFYKLYPQTEEGKKALEKAEKLLDQYSIQKILKENNEGFIEKFISFINKQPGKEIEELPENQLTILEKLSEKLLNRCLKGFKIFNEEEMLTLPSEEIDLSRAMLLSQMDGAISIRKIRSYEAFIDLLALQIQSKWPSNPNPEQKIRAINSFIFEEMGYRFPPHSKHVEEIDLYTFLPSVLDSRRGVCLGVSILYLSLAQRLGLSLEAITPPGHIYIRYKNEQEEINIETTARGIHLPSEEYLGLDTRKLQTRSIKEVVGLAHMNKASVHLNEERYNEAIKCYEKALLYLPNDPLILEFKGYCHLFIGEKDKGENLLQQVANKIQDFAVNRHTGPEDYLNGNAAIKTLRALFLNVDEKRASLIKKKEALEIALADNPKFREGWQSLAITWLQLHRPKEALKILEYYHLLDPTHATIEYYLAVINENRMNYKKAWEHLKYAEEITASRNHFPLALKILRRKLNMKSPE